MIRVEAIEELLELELGTKFYKFVGGRNIALIFAGKHPRINAVIAISDYNYETSVVITERMFKYSEFYVGPYDSKICGQIMLRQINAEVESVKLTYFK